MTRNDRSTRRAGSILPLIVVSMVAMCGFVALAVDVGLIAVAKTQCQIAADSSAMAGARSIDGSVNQNLGAIGTAGSALDNTLVVAQANQVLGGTIPAGNVTMTFGAWHYDKIAQQFIPQFPPVSPDNYNLVQVGVAYNVQTSFGPVFNAINPSFNSVFNVTAQAMAAHRPRDLAIILDFSGSMNNESDLWNNESYLGSGTPPNGPNNTSNNIETVYPRFGHYANEKNYNDYTNYANLLCPAVDPASPLFGNASIGKSNVTMSILGVPAMVNDLYQNDRGATPIAAFAAAPDSYANGTDPAQGDNFLAKNGMSVPNYAKTVEEILGTTTYTASWETSGYQSKTGQAFKGYTVGPRYWGKTFFIWPPDPTNDWRKKYFFLSNGTTPLNDNTMLFQNAAAGIKDPAGNYVINYQAILAWIKSNPCPFPAKLRSGSVLFYDQIPTNVPASAYDHTQSNANISDLNQRFWKEYIDYVLGVWRAPLNGIQRPQNPACSYGPDYNFGTLKISVPPTGSPAKYMDYQDNVKRPRHRFWFGPMSMVQFISDTGILPGTSHDISMYPMKQGVATALKDIQNNHPNDVVSMLLFCRPQYNNDPPNVGAFSAPQFNLTNNYPAMISSLWTPPNAVTSDVRPYATAGQQSQIPRAYGDYTANTASSYGFMLAYNQFSSGAGLLTPPSGGGPVGGSGRKGASRVVIYETDGMANQDSIAVNGFQNLGPYNSYYSVRPGDPVNGAGYSSSNLLQVVEAICNKDDGTPYQSIPSGYPTPPNYPGYATSNRPVTIHTIAFGAIFETPNSAQSSTVPLLQQISTIGGTVFPSSPTDPANGYKWCIGTLSQRQAKLGQAFLNILDSAIPVSLIK